MAESLFYPQLDILAFDRITLEHALVLDNHSCRQNSRGYGIYGETTAVLEMGLSSTPRRCCPVLRRNF